MSTSDIKNHLKNNPEQAAQLKGDINCFTAYELSQREFKAVKFTVKDILPVGISLVCGKPKIGKSWLMMDLGLCIALDKYFLGGAVNKGRVLYLALEDNPRRLKQRMDLVLKGEPAPVNLHFADKWPRVDQGGAEMIDRFIEKYPDTVLIIIDTFQKIKAKPSRQNSNVYGEDYISIEPLKAITDKHDISLLLVHHLRKAGSDDVFETISGSTGLTGAVDNIMVLSKDRARADAVLTITGRDISDKEIALSWDNTATQWKMLGNAVEYRMSQERQAVVNLLRENDTLMSPKEIAAALNKNYNTMKVLLSNMYKEGQINNANGKYYYKNNINSINHINYNNSINCINPDNKVGLGLCEDNNPINSDNPIEIADCKQMGLGVYGVYEDTPDWVKEADALLGKENVG